MIVSIELSLFFTLLKHGIMSESLQTLSENRLGGCGGGLYMGM